MVRDPGGVWGDCVVVGVAALYTTRSAGEGRCDWLRGVPSDRWAVFPFRRTGDLAVCPVYRSVFRSSGRAGLYVLDLQAAGTVCENQIYGDFGGVVSHLGIGWVEFFFGIGGRWDEYL